MLLHFSYNTSLEAKKASQMVPSLGVRKMGSKIYGGKKSAKLHEMDKKKKKKKESDQPGARTQNLLITRL